MKKVMAFLLITSLILLVSACGKESEESKAEPVVPVDTEQVDKEKAGQEKEKEEEVEQPKEEEQPEEQPEGLAAVINHFKSAGFEVGEVTVKAFELIEAKDGFGIQLNGQNVEFYEFDSDSKNLKDATTIGKVSMDGLSFPVIAHETFIISNYDKHPDKDLIIQTFKEFK